MVITLATMVRVDEDGVSVRVVRVRERDRERRAVLMLILWLSLTRMTDGRSSQREPPVRPSGLNRERRKIRHARTRTPRREFCADQDLSSHRRRRS